MSRGALLLVLAGCGRLHFQPLGGAGDASGGDDAITAIDAGIVVPCRNASGPAYVQTSCNTNHGMPALVSIAVATTGPLTVGNLLVVAVDFDGVTGTVVITDSVGNVFEMASPLERSVNQSDQIWYAVVAIGGPDVVTATFDGLTGGIGLYSHEYEGLATSNEVDTFVSAIGNGTAIASPPLTTTGPGEMLFAHGMTEDAVGSPGVGFTSRSTCNGNMTEDQLAVSAGTYTATFTAGPANWLTTFVALRPCTML